MIDWRSITPHEALVVDDTAGHEDRARARGLAGIVYRSRRQPAESLRAWSELPALSPEDTALFDPAYRPG